MSDKINEYVISLANRTDYEGLRNYLNTRGRDLLQSGTLPRLSDRELENLFNRQHTRIAQARTVFSRNIVGTAMLCFTYSWRGVFGSIEYVHIRDDYRRKGIACAMMNFLHNEARIAGVQALHLVSEPHRKDARSLYKKLGYSLEKDLDSDSLISDRHFVLIL